LPKLAPQCSVAQDCCEEDLMARPYRSVLYIPAANARAMEKAQTLPADAIIFDLEDAVAPGEKPAARDALATALGNDYGPRARIVRINGLATEWGEDDARFCATLAADAVLIPKVDSAADLDRVAALIPDTPLWAMMETPLGMLNAAQIAAHPRLEGMVMGTNDLAKELNSRFRPDRLPMQAGLGLCLLAAKAHGKVIVDGVFNAFKDEDGLRAECEQGRDMGFDGKTLIHPAQLAVANESFAPTDAEIDLARRQIEAFSAAAAEGKGVAVVDGKIVENLHAETARKTLDRAKAIAAVAG
jgi:(3S)-malyl-CoA thioesterase